jgi:hypothetical protein
MVQMVPDFDGSTCNFSTLQRDTHLAESILCVLSFDRFPRYHMTYNTLSCWTAMLNHSPQSAMPSGVQTSDNLQWAVLLNYDVW